MSSSRGSTPIAKTKRHSNSRSRNDSPDDFAAGPCEVRRDWTSCQHEGRPRCACHPGRHHRHRRLVTVWTQLATELGARLTGATEFVSGWENNNQRSSDTASLTSRRVYTRFIDSIYPFEGLLVTKRLIDLDDDLLAAAQRELSTSGVSDTVRVALQQAAAKSARARQIEWLEQGGLESMAGLDERGEVWR